MKAIVYSLFGNNKERNPDCFDFNTYLRGLLINIRMNRLIFPGWDICLQTDKDTYDGWKGLFDRLPIHIEVHDNDVPLTLAMLWRLRPVFEQLEGKWKYSHVLCRDLDSPPTYREAQAVQYWINRNTSFHAITDSVSHDVPLLGGMIGVRPDYFSDRMNVRSWRDLININPNFNWAAKGSDQSFLTQVVYPKFSQHGGDSITQHYFKGMPNSFLQDYKTCLCEPTIGHVSGCLNNIDVPIPYELKESNAVCGHIGAAGYYPPVLHKFMAKHKSKFDDINEIEKDYKHIFYWA